MINTKIIIKEILKIMKLPHDYVKVTKSKKTLTFYEQY